MDGRSAALTTAGSYPLCTHFSQIYIAIVSADVGHSKAVFSISEIYFGAMLHPLFGAAVELSAAISHEACIVCLAEPLTTSLSRT
jgi:hypothetical protein